MSTPPGSRDPSPVPASAPEPGTEESPPRERRARAALRALIDEMLLQIRATTKSDQWSEQERARAEADLERIMESVRREALRDQAEE